MYSSFCSFLARFDKLLYLGVSEDRTSQLKIMQALTRKWVRLPLLSLHLPLLKAHVRIYLKSVKNCHLRFELSEDCSLERIVEQCPFNMTGADFYALCSDAMLSALKVKIEQLEAGMLHTAAVFLAKCPMFDTCA